MEMQKDAWEQRKKELRDLQVRLLPDEGPFVDIELSSPTAWRMHAEHYRAVADVVMQTRRPFILRKLNQELPAAERKAAEAHPLGRGAAEYLLLGLAVELMLKAVWFVQRPGIYTIAPKAWKKRGHDLAFLADSVKLTLTSSERRQLEDLGEYVLRLARYPSGFERKNSVKMSWSVTYKHCAALYDRAEALYREGWERFPVDRKREPS